MDNKDFSNLGEQIRDSVQNAIDSMDFKQLNRTISDTVNFALDEAKNQLDKGLNRSSSGKTGQDIRQNQGKELNQNQSKTKEPGYKAFQTSYSGNKWADIYRGKAKQELDIVPMNQPGKIAGVLYIVFGSIGLGIMGIIFLAVWLMAMIGVPSGLVNGLAVFFFILTGLSGVMLGNGISIKGRLKRARIYAKQAGKKMFCQIEDLARNVGKSKGYVVRDLQKMIDKGIFPEGHLDHQKTCLILDNATYQQYLESRKSLEDRQKEAIAVAQKKQEEKQEWAALPEDVKKMMEEGQNYVRILREANDAIPGEVISEKIYRLETIIQRIFQTVEKHPEQMEEMERFMDYYLPTTVKLVNAYRDFDSVDIPGENIISAKHEIEETLDTINLAFERLLDDMYQDAAFDISAEASVLQTMLKKDGWTESDFTGGKKYE